MRNGAFGSAPRWPSHIGKVNFRETPDYILAPKYMYFKHIELVNNTWAVNYLKKIRIYWSGTTYANNLTDFLMWFACRKQSKIPARKLHH